MDTFNLEGRNGEGADVVVVGRGNECGDNPVRVEDEE